jgi:hypothetical protein
MPLSTIPQPVARPRPQSQRTWPQASSVCRTPYDRPVSRQSIGPQLLMSGPALHHTALCRDSVTVPRGSRSLTTA